MVFSVPLFVKRQQYKLVPQQSPTKPLQPLPMSTVRRRFHIPPRARIFLLPLTLAVVIIAISTLHPPSGVAMDATADYMKDWWSTNVAGLLWEEGWEEDGWGPVPVWLPGGTAGASRSRVESGECKGWDHQKPVGYDPRGCVKARQYRQTVAVLEREEIAAHDHWHFARDHNIETLGNLTRCFLPVAHPDFTPCPDKPLVIASYWYAAQVLEHATTGESIWMAAVMKQLAMLGYSWIAIGPWGNWQTVVEMMPDVYNVLWSGDLDAVSCITDPRCIAKEHYAPPEGAEDLSIGVPDEERGVIPLWALYVQDVWGARPREISPNGHWWGLTQDGDWSFQPLGQDWVITPWQLPGHTQLSYSMEEQCHKIPVIPPEERKHAALVYGKRSSYFHYPHVSRPEFWTNLSRDNDFDLILTATIEEDRPLPEGLHTIGKQTPEGFEELVASVKAVVGIGLPTISPSVYNALCQATPVVLPYFHDPVNGGDWKYFSAWSQHGPAAIIGEPYVYSYHARNYTMLQEQVRKAVSTPIERYFPEDMRLPYVLKQLHEHLNRPAKSIMAERVAANGGKVPRMMKGLRERCFELKRCKPLLAEGRRPAVPAGRFD
ncbi:hypothetical protein IAT38_000094 [Cryptococcus sp. DSM 104549]